MRVRVCECELAETGPTCGHTSPPCRCPIIKAQMCVLQIIHHLSQPEQACVLMAHGAQGRADPGWTPMPRRGPSTASFLEDLPEKPLGPVLAGTGSDSSAPVRSRLLFLTSGCESPWRRVPRRRRGRCGACTGSASPKTPGSPASVLFCMVSRTPRYTVCPASDECSLPECRGVLLRTP